MFKKLILLIIGLFLLNDISYANNKIELIINNEIITSIDIENEIKYLGALNPSILKLEKSKLLDIAKDSLVKQIIKKNEILKNTNSIEIDKKVLDILLKNIYSNLEIDTKQQFLDYLKNQNIEIDTIYKKISIESLWNQLIYLKYSSKVKIDKQNLENEINLKKNQNVYLLYEIIYNVKDTSQKEIKYKQILDSIKTNGFENTALIFSISDSSKVGGKVGWINESSINPKIKNDLEGLDIGAISKPISIPGGFIILKIAEIKKKEISINYEEELSNLIKQKTNFQLNQYSNIYYYKIRQNAKIKKF